MSNCMANMRKKFKKAVMKAVREHGEEFIFGLLLSVTSQLLVDAAKKHAGRRLFA